VVNFKVEALFSICGESVEGKLNYLFHFSRFSRSLALQ